MQEASQYAFDHSIPLYVTLELTQSCNFSCKHCYNFDRSDEKKMREAKNNLTIEQWKKIIDDVVSEGGFYFSFSGGEPLTSPYLVELIKHVRSHHCIAKLKTNGSLLTRNNIDQLYNAGLYSMEISLYGADEKSYEQFTGVRSLHKILTAIDYARSKGMEITLNILLHKENYWQIGEMVELAKSRGLYFNISEEITDRYDGTGGESLWRLTEDELRWLFESEYKEYFDYDNREHNVQCSCARTVCGVNYRGDVFPCIGAPLFSGSLLKQSFEEIWNDAPTLKDIRQLQREDFASCSQCEFIDKCSRSSGTIYVNTGKYTGCDNDTLKVAQLRTQYFSVKK